MKHPIAQLGVQKCIIRAFFYKTKHRNRTVTSNITNLGTLNNTVDALKISSVLTLLITTKRQSWERVAGSRVRVESRVNDVESRVEFESFRATTQVKSICTTDSSQVESMYIQTQVESRISKY